MTFKLKFILLLVFVFLFGIRMFKLTENPEGFDPTEAGFGYNAYSILKTGRDEYGKFMPLVLESVGDYKLAGYSYWQIPFIILFNLNEFSIRFSAVTAGVISLLLTYQIILEIFKKHKIALLTLFFTGISPWHIILSRMGYDPIVALMFYLLSILLFLKWYKKNKVFLFILSSLSLCLSVFTYYSVWIIAPFTLILYCYILFKNKHSTIKELIILSLILLLPVITVLKLLIVTQGQRLSQDSTIQVKAQPLLEEQIREEKKDYAVLLTRLFHNKTTFYPMFILQNLSNNMSFDFLFLNGDKIDRRFYVPYSGVLYLITAPFLLLGILYFIKNYSAIKSFLIFGTILLVFIGSTFSEFGSETERTLFTDAIFCYLISYGLLIFYNWFYKYRLSPIFLMIICAGFVLNISYFNHQYYWHANVHQPWGRNYGAKELVSTVSEIKNKYKSVVVPENTYIFFYFFNKTDPKIAQIDSLAKSNELNYLKHPYHKKIENYIAMPIECPAAGKLNVLYVCQGNAIPPNSNMLKIIRFRDNQPAFIFLEFTPHVSVKSPPLNINYMKKFGIINDNENKYWKSEPEVQ